MNLVGPKQVKLDVAAFLQARLPEYLATFRAEREVSEKRLPDPVDYLANPPLALDRFPRIAVEVRRLPSMRRVEVTDDAGYWTTYATAVYSWVKTDGWNATYEQRDDLITVLRRLFLDRPHLDYEPLGTYLAEETSLTEDYTDVTPVNGDRFVAGGTTTFNLRVSETISRAGIGIVDAIDVPTIVLHPALS